MTRSKIQYKSSQNVASKQKNILDLIGWETTNQRLHLGSPRRNSGTAGWHGNMETRLVEPIRYCVISPCYRFVKADQSATTSNLKPLKTVLRSMRAVLSTVLHSSLAVGVLAGQHSNFPYLICGFIYIYNILYQCLFVAALYS